MYLRPRDILIFETIQRHGPLPSHYLYEFTKSIAKDIFGFRKRLLVLVRAAFLDRPLQLNHPLIVTDFKSYVLTRRAEEALASLGKLNRYSAPAGGGYQHAFMCASITANIELEATRAGFAYIGQEEILSRHTCPAETKNADKPLTLETSISHVFKQRGGNPPTRHSNRRTHPDQLFGINYGNGFRFFALEADRGTEPLVRQNLDNNSILRKLLSYKYILEHGIHQKRFGIPNLNLLFVTTSQERARNVLQLARQTHPNGAPNLLFKAIPGLCAYFRTPPLLPELFTEPYGRPGHQPLSINKV